MYTDVQAAEVAKFINAVNRGSHYDFCVMDVDDKEVRFPATQYSCAVTIQDDFGVEFFDNLYKELFTFAICILEITKGDATANIAIEAFALDQEYLDQ